MSRPKCDFLSGADITTNIVKALVAKVLELGGNADDVYALITKGGAHKLEPIARILVEKPAKVEPPKKPIVPEPTIEKIDVQIDQTKSLEQLKTDDNYPEGCVNSNIIEKNFPMGPIPAGKELVRVCFHRRFCNKDEVVAARSALNLEAVTSPAYLLTVGAKEPDLQKQGPIVDIDSNWTGPGGYVHCLCLWFDGRKRELRLYWFGFGFDGDCWFLAFRNIQP